MRAVFQTQPEVGHIYLGSKRHILDKIFSNKNEAFWRSAKRLEIGMNPRETFASFVKARFESTDKGITAIQMLDEDGLAGNYVVVLLMESVAAIVAGIAFRSRVLVLGGSAGAALGALRALLIVSHLLPLYVVFGSVALVLLAISAILAAMREQVTAFRSEVSHAWGAWEL